MPVDLTGLQIIENATIPTWFGIGGLADRLARPASVEELRECLCIDPHARVLGDGANLLVADEGVGELVIDTSRLAGVRIDAVRGLVWAEAGARLPKLINETVRLGLAGLECLGGIPASVGGAVVMNAGGAFGQIADAVMRVHGLDRRGQTITLERDRIDFAYRHSGLAGMVVTSVDLRLTPADPGPLRRRHLEIMAYKKNSQPLKDRSAGCIFRNPTLGREVAEIGAAGERVSAGLLIDRAGCKGWVRGGARVSDAHANFVTATTDACAADVIALMESVAARVREQFGVELEPEVVVWKRGSQT